MALTTRPTGAEAGGAETGLCPHLVADLLDWKHHLHTRSFTRVSVDMLLRDLRRTVPSALGYTLVLTAVPGLPEVSITVAQGPLAHDVVRSSVTFALPVAHDLDAGVTFYAGDEGAFGQLATLLGTSTTFGSGHVRLGGSPDADVVPGVRGLADHTQVSYALGVLLSRGKTFEQAQHHLQRLADRLGSLEAAAAHLLTSYVD